MLMGHGIDELHCVNEVYPLRSDGLKVGGKVFAMSVHGNLVVELPRRGSRSRS